jgi:hypothetical protein
MGASLLINNAINKKTDSSLALLKFGMNWGFYFENGSLYKFGTEYI